MSAAPKLLVIGAAGFLGSHLLGAAAEAGIEVVGATRSAGSGAVCDLLEPPSIAACLETVAPDLIVNAAGSASVGRSWEQPAETFAVNATGVLNLLEAVAAQRPASHVLCLSSADVYGAREADELPLGEDLAPRPVTPYGESKAAMEEICDRYAGERGLSVAVVRAFNLVGPGQSPQFAVSGFARRIAEAERGNGGAVELALGNPAALRDFTDVRDGARALLEISRRRLGGTYNLCSGRPATIAQLVEGLGAVAWVPVRHSEDPSLARPIDPPALVGDPRRLREATGFAAETPLAQSLSDLLDWWRGRLQAA